MIRRMEPADTERVSEIWLEANREAHGFIPASYWEENFQMVKEMLPLAEVYVWEDTGGIQGFVGLNGDYIEGIFVKGSCRSAGVGRKLMDHCKETRSSLRLNVYEKNRRALAFYLREGFQITAEGVDEATEEREYGMEWRKRNSSKI